MLPVPEASVPAVEICSERSAAGMIRLGQRDAVVGEEDHLEPALLHAGSLLTISATALMSLMISLAMR